MSDLADRIVERLELHRDALLETAATSPYELLRTGARLKRDALKEAVNIVRAEDEL